MPKRLNPNLAKIHRSYQVEEIASLFGVHKNTVRSWVKVGLPVSDDLRPMLILGHELRQFLKNKNQQAKCPCRPDQLYCLKCRAAQKPAGDMVEYISMNESRGRLVALCPACDGLMNKFTNLAKLELIRHKMSITMPKELKRISKRNDSLLNSDFR